MGCQAFWWRQLQLFGFNGHLPYNGFKHSPVALLRDPLAVLIRENPVGADPLKVGFEKRNVLFHQEQMASSAVRLCFFLNWLIMNEGYRGFDSQLLPFKVKIIFG